jgi:hypothetical protein
MISPSRPRSFKYLISIIKSRDSSVGTATGYGLDDPIRFPAGAGNFSLRYHFQTGYRAHTTSCPMATGGFFPWVRRPGHEADNSSPSSAGIKNAWNYTSTPPIRLHGMVLISVQRQSYLLPFIHYNSPPDLHDQPIVKLIQMH